MEPKVESSGEITRNFGRGYRNITIISSAVFALMIFFYIYTAGSYFESDVYPLEHRANHQITFYKYIINKQVDQGIIAFGTVLWLALSSVGRTRIISCAIYGGLSLGTLVLNPDAFEVIALFSIPIMISFLIIDRFPSRKILNSSVSLSLNYIGIIVATISLLSIIITLTPLFAPESKSIAANDYAYDIYILISSIAPILIFFFIMSSPFKLLIIKFKNGKNKINSSSLLSANIINRKTKVLLLLLIMLLSMTLAVIPHQPAFNTNNGEIGADTEDYVGMVGSVVKSNSAQELVHQAFVNQLSGDRPITLLFIATITKLVPANFAFVIDHIPLVLAPLLVLAVFFLTKEITSNDTASMFAAFLTAVSFQTLVGTYSAIYANWFALIIGYTTIIFLIRFLKKPRKLNLILYSTFLIILLFSHVYTWTILSLIIGLFLVVLLRLNYFQKKTILILLTVLLLSVGVDFLRTIITGYPGGIERDLGLAHRGAGQQQLLLIWQNLVDTTQNYSGGQFNNFIILTLGIYWIFRSNSREISSILLLIFLSVGVLPLLFGNTVIQTRYLYDVPLQIPAAIMFTYIMKKHKGHLIVFPAVIWLLAISFKALSNFS